MIAKSAFYLRGSTVVHIDWANVYGWKETRSLPITPFLLDSYFQLQPEIKEKHFYFGTDVHPRSKAFLGKVSQAKYVVHTKPVKKITVSKSPLIIKRKCDFDIEITMQVLEQLDQFDCYIFFSGDGDFAPLYQFLIKRGKQVIVVFSSRHAGRELWQNKKILKIRINTFIKKYPPKL